ncbi:MAG: prolyl oligopeptidase family serine peptidase [Oscillospiraceae bacterium]|jgi:predicted esterase|nr:prolyl oligopeptidase family serine peptidase [Oscillospiraceae bacterium]
MEKIVCFTGIEAPGGVTEVRSQPGAPDHNVYKALVDGALTDVRILPEFDLRGEPGYAMWPGVYECTFGGGGYVTKTRLSENLIAGYTVAAPRDGAIRLGDREYRFEPDAPMWMFGKAGIPEDYAKKVADAEAGWDDYWFVRLNPAGEIAEMWVSHQPAFGDGAILEQIRKFRSAWGPKAANGLAIEYNYFGPRAADGVKYPVFVWFHGLHSGTHTQTSLFEFNPIANWAKDEMQSRFAEGGAYIIAPRANEDLRDGHGMSWNSAQVEPFFLMLRDFLKQHPDADADRVFIGGFSMGGFMTWLCLAAHPERVKGAVPCCGMYVLSEDERKAALSVPVFCVHGEGDFDTDGVRTEMKPYLGANEKSRIAVLAHGYLFPDGVTPTPVDHLVWIPALNDFEFNDGTDYADADGAKIPRITGWINAIR